MASKVITLNTVINLMVWKPNLTIHVAAVKSLGIQTIHLSNILKIKDIVGERGVVKYTIPSPNQLMYPIQWDTGVYATRAEFAKDVQQAYKDAIKAFYDAGCRYLQFDDVYWGSLCNNHLKPEFEADKAQALENIQVVLAVKPADMVITTHVCHWQLPFNLFTNWRI